MCCFERVFDTTIYNKTMKHEKVDLITTRTC